MKLQILVSHYLKHKDIRETLPINDKMLISNQVRQRSVMEGMLMEAVTIEGWLRHIEKIGGDG